MRAIPEPMRIYEPMATSQQRRSTPRAQQDPATEDSSSDDDDDPIVRRRRARLKKEAAWRQLTSVSFHRRRDSDDVEVPSTSRKDRRTRRTARTCSPERTSLDDPDGGLRSQEKVENSQTLPSRSEQHPPVQRLRPNDSGETSEARLPEKPVFASSMGSKSPANRRLGVSRVPRLDHASAEPDMSNPDAIPETSPIDKRFDVFPSAPDNVVRRTPSASASASASDAGPPHCLFPDARTRPRTRMTLSAPPMPGHADQQAGARHASRDPSPISTSSAPVGTAPDALEAPSSAPSLPGTVQDPTPEASSSPVRMTRLKRRRQDAAARVVDPPPAPSSAPSLPRQDSTSTLSSLSSTPSLSSSTTPTTHESIPPRKAAPDPDTDAPHSSPGVSRARRSAVLKLKTATDEGGRTTSRFVRWREACSTDELNRSPSLTPTFEQSHHNFRASTSRLGRASGKTQGAAREQSHRAGGRIFEGMAFAISFQSKKPGETADQYNERMKLAKSLETKIASAGGRILNDGFDELFEIRPVRNATTSAPSRADLESGPGEDGEGLTLSAAARALGFTALIADGHSRKVKYMQALALGLPCLAPRWVTACLDRNAIVDDWTPYLLCAGQSAFLGDAVRSRNLAPYDASKATLAEVVDRRSRILQGSRILLVMSSSSGGSVRDTNGGGSSRAEQESKRMAYVFLARALGASLFRVPSLAEAPACLRAMEEAGRPFDWIYVDGKADAGGQSSSSLSEPSGRGGGAAAARNTGKKRKRGKVNEAAGSGTGTAAWLWRQGKKIRTLSDELVIQSLILGRLIEEGELAE
ncbi:hypothetical protein VTK73DRAFT_9454 [Phialemonium thermophilum]|uniref:BRCT domain-containing protein n=1 Tax=Phialemonium thermophilum TaxID=223376 RepID=A0ABR3W2D5_9PEZI